MLVHRAVCLGTEKMVPFENLNNLVGFVTNFLYTGTLTVYRDTHCVSKNNTDVAHYNFDVDQPILITFGRCVAERIRYQTLICCPTSPN